jgi:2-keto-4-pentenoate hydratase
MPESRIERAGQSLYKEFIAREEFSLMVGPEAPADIEEAYSVQDVYMDLKAADSGGYAGYKIAYTTKVMQERLGAKEPVYGRILSDGVFNSPCKVKASDYVNIGVECEVAVTLGNDLLQSEAPFTRETVYESVAHIALNSNIYVI